MQRKEKIAKFKQTNEHDIHSYYRIDEQNVHIPILWYQTGDIIKMVDIVSTKLFYNEYGLNFKDLDRSTFDTIFEGKIKIIKR